MSVADGSDNSMMDDRPPVRGEHARQVGWSERRYHASILLISCTILVLSATLRIDSPAQVVVPGVGIALPSACMFRNLTGIDCPGCGLTRSFVSLAHGRWNSSLSYHPLGWIFFGIVLGQIPLRTLQLWRLGRGKPLVVVPGVVGCIWVLMLLLVGQWLVRGIIGQW